MRFALLCSIVLVLPFASASSQTERQRDFRNVFEEIQQGFETATVSLFSSYFATQVQVNLKGEESGYFSSNHAYYILEKYLKARKVVSFEFTSVSEEAAVPYATGSAVFNHKGGRENAQVYVSLVQSEGRWQIAEINIY
ncbi:MAG: DUF4783 domain-containing protein [Ignavibacteriae bacterium]|nr:DUF4783 domain-containing protein [Ignavibacteriota bacterium]